MARGKAKVIAINNSWQLVPWADILFACDAKWWDHNEGCPEFGGVKLTTERVAAERWGIGCVECVRGDDRLRMEPKGTVGWGGNGGFHCLNLAVQMGVYRVLLVGYDMRVDLGTHWHGDHPSGLNNPTQAHADRWRAKIDAAAREIKLQGVEVLNCSEVSALRNYERARFEDAINA